MRYQEDMFLKESRNDLIRVIVSIMCSNKVSNMTRGIFGSFAAMLICGSNDRSGS